MGKRVNWTGWVDKKDRELHENLPSGLRSRFKSEVEEVLKSSSAVAFDYRKPLEEAEKLWKQSVKDDFDNLDAEYRKISDEIDEAYKVLHDKRQALSASNQKRQEELWGTLSKFEAYKVAHEEVKPKMEALVNLKQATLESIRAKYEAKIS